MKPFELSILGSSSAVPTRSRHQSAQILNIHDRLILIDAGENVQQRLLQNEGLKSSRIEHIFISHLHPDHFIGLIGLLCSYGLVGRKKPVKIIAPRGIQRIIEVQLAEAQIHAQYSIDFVSIEELDIGKWYEESHFRFRILRLEHRVDCYGFHFEEKKRGIHLLPEKLKAANLPVEAYNQMANGQNFIDRHGRTHRFEEYSKPAAPPRTYVYMTDTLFLPELAGEVEGVDLLYHDATFAHELVEKAKETYHSTAREAAIFANLAEAGQLLLGHFSSRYINLAPLLEEARKEFPVTELATEGRCFSVNLKEPINETN